jgi:alpha-1,3-rhamnosyltransferase
MSLILNQPKVSIIVPSHNHGKYISQCIESIVCQTYRNYELIVIDDGSTDDSRVILSKLQEKFNFLLIFQKNIGLVNTLNRAILDFAKGEYLAFCASDDYWFAEKIEMQVKYLEQNDAVAMCYGKSVAVDENSIVNNKYTLAINKNLRGGHIFRNIILGEFHPPVNYMIRKNVLIEVGLYNSRIHTEDFYMNLKISEKYQIGYINEFMAYYRVIQAEQKRLNLKIFHSKISCVNEYKNNILYSKAIKNIKFNGFIEYSPYAKFKLFSIQCLLRSGINIFRMGALKGIIKLIFFWK